MSVKAKGHATILTEGNRLVEKGITTQAKLDKACGITPGVMSREGDR